VSSRLPALIDTHAHLDDDQFAGDVENVIQRAVAAGVQRIVNIGYRPERWRTTLAFADRFSEIAFTLGLHPHHAEEWSPSTESTLRGLIDAQRPVALGEIGLDYFRNFNPPALQRTVFERQLEIALELGLPVVIHQRAAELDLIDALKNAPANLVCILHSFDGTAELAEFGLARGYYFGVGGLMTRAASAELKSVLSSIPIERFLIETDSPYLVPAGTKNRRNEPANCVIIAGQLAELKHVEIDDLIKTCSRNAELIFGNLLSTSAPTGDARK
jgi:TatD DNase family protein